MINDSLGVSHDTLTFAVPYIFFFSPPYHIHKDSQRNCLWKFKKPDIITEVKPFVTLPKDARTHF